MKVALAALIALLALPSAVVAEPVAQSVDVVFVKKKNVYVYDAVTAATTRLTGRRDAVGDVALAPDGKWAAYTASVSRGTDIRVVALVRGLHVHHHRSAVRPHQKDVGHVPADPRAIGADQPERLPGDRGHGRVKVRQHDPG